VKVHLFDYLIFPQQKAKAVKKQIILISGCFFLITNLNSQTIWEIDPDHSSVQFSVTHLVVSSVTGDFNEFEGVITTTGEGFENAVVEAVIQVSSIDTENITRDNHLRDEDFFFAEEFPTISFNSISFRETSENQFEVVGDLTMRNVTKKITLRANYGGEVIAQGKTLCGFEATGSLNRFEYGLQWDDTLDSGSLVVGEDVEIKFNLRLVKKN